MAQAERTLHPERSALDRFGYELRRLRKMRAFSLARLADLVYVSGDLLQKIETAERRPNQQLAERLEQALRAEGMLLDLWHEIGADEAATKSSGLLPAVAAAKILRVAHGGRVIEALDVVGGEHLRHYPDDEERTILAARHPRRYDPGVVDALATVLSGQRRTEDMIGSASLIEPVKAQLVVVRDLVTEARGELRGEVLDIGSQWAQFAGWLHASVGRLSQASQLYGLALEWALEADKPNMVATALNMQGHAAWLGAKAGPIIGLSRAAQRDKRISPGVRALAVQQEARGIALSGEAKISDIDRKFDFAENLVAQAAEKPENEPPWIYFFSHDYLILQRGLAYRLLGEYVKANDLLTAGLSTIPAEMRQTEWTAYYLLDLAKTYAKSGDIATSCSVVREINLIAQQTNSERLRKALADFQERLQKKWPADPRVTQLAENLH